MKPTDTKQKIMDTAEHLFARDGYRGTSLRAITGKAGVNLAAVNYHFGSKTSLLETVI
ncbi:MAG TPA: TetR/AcrR family transcriptional regulator, partial [Nitrospirae bacterium]|nr:TetR/AcrR family transcriptional regulator [Nitrospirota bacterium]